MFCLALTSFIRLVKNAFLFSNRLRYMAASRRTRFVESDIFYSSLVAALARMLGVSAILFAEAAVADDGDSVISEAMNFE